MFCRHPPEPEPDQPRPRPVRPLPMFLAAAFATALVVSTVGFAGSPPAVEEPGRASRRVTRTWSVTPPEQFCKIYS